MNNHKYTIPEELLNMMTLVDSYFPTDIGNPLGIKCYSQELDGDFYLRIFHLLYDETDQNYNIVGELPSIKFKTEPELIQFSNNLPHMNGIEMMLFLYQSNFFHNFQINQKPGSGDNNGRLN